MTEPTPLQVPGFSVGPPYAPVMSLFGTAMTYYPYVFHPITVLGASIALLIHHEWALQRADRDELRRRLEVFLGSGVLALIPTGTYFVVTGGAVYQSTQGNSWQMDALVASGLFVVAGALIVAWHRYEWGDQVPTMMVTLAAVTVPYVALSPLWNVSGHVIIALMPTLHLTLVARKYWPLLLVPLVMVPNRIYLDAHTWAQTIGAVVIAAAITLGLYWHQTRESATLFHTPS